MPFDEKSSSREIPNFLWNNGADNEYIEFDFADDQFETVDGCPVEVDSDQFWAMRDGIDERTTCPFCGSQLRLYNYERHKEFRENRATFGFDLAVCMYCFFWQFAGRTWLAGHYMTGASHSLALSCALTFDKPPPECHNELAQYLRRNPDHWHSLSPKDLERLVASIFRANHGDCEVLHVGRPGDGGKDVILVHTDGHSRTMLEVKRRRHEGAVEPVTTVRHLLGVLAAEAEHNLRGIVVSTASHFSYSAQLFSERAARVGYPIKLVDRGILNKMLEPLVRKESYLELLRRTLPQDDMIPKVQEFFRDV